MENQIVFDHYKYLIYLVNCAINESLPSYTPQNIDFSKIIKLGKRLSIASLLYPILKDLKNDTLTPEILKQYKDNYDKHLYKDIIQQEDIKNFINFCEEQKIKNVPLKGSVVKHYYPQTYMRTMGDIDIWVDKERLSDVDKYLISLGFECKEKSTTDDKYIKKPISVFEVHKEVTRKEFSTSSYFNQTVFENLEPNGDYKYSFNFSKTDLYLHLVDHAAKHFVEGGLSTKMLLDFYVVNENFKKTLSKTDFINIDKKLENLNYKVFNDTITNLAYNWFVPNGTGLEDDEISKYIISSGLFGTAQNLYKYKSAVENKSKNLFFHILRWIFPTPTMIKQAFEKPNKKPYLIPLYYFVWWGWKFNIYVLKRTRNKENIKTVASGIKGAKNSNSTDLKSLSDSMKLNIK